MPPLAREAVTAAALRGDAVALLAACRDASAGYEHRRAAAFVSALAGRRESALRELGLGAGVRSLRLGVDTAVVELLTRGPAHGVDAVGAALRDGFHSEPDVPLVLAECVRRNPETARAALAVAVSGGTPVERARAAAAVVRAARPERSTAAVPALLAISLLLAVFVFARLPGLDEGDEAAVPRLTDRPPAVVTAPRPAAAKRPAQERESRPTAADTAVLVSRRTTATPRSIAPRVRTTARGPGRVPPRRGPSPPPAPAAPPAPAPSAPSPAPAPAAVVQPATPTTRVVARKQEKPKPDKAERKALKRATTPAAAPAPAQGDPAPAPPAAATATPGPPDHAQANGHEKNDNDKSDKHR